ncbi:hypothetical protein LshimejAT787_0309820 [Lyophyllum shimeji]|uniref:Uncharacterized protein n=1 Tax=Lyophyllum shimeji TaxID=47721 RepID=A0A9P3PIQ8_LYOSH|nr:hypothetical protein LshimejAT787_0309820 [Lyophyllum shimeji]
MCRNRRFRNASAVKPLRLTWLCGLRREGCHCLSIYETFRAPVSLCDFVLLFRIFYGLSGGIHGGHRQCARS